MLNDCWLSDLMMTCRSANLILNLFSLMVDANVPDIALEPDKTVKKVQRQLHVICNVQTFKHYIF